MSEVASALVGLLNTHQLQIDHAAFARSRYPTLIDPVWGEVVRVPVGDVRHLLEHHHRGFVGDAHECRFASLRELFDASGVGAVPPIFISAPGNNLTDGYHRVQIAIERGLEHLSAVWVRGRALR